MSLRNALLKRRTDQLLDGGDLPSAGVAGSGKLFGLSADFPELIEVPVAEIHRNPDQPRKSFDAGEIAALAASIQRHGLQNPVIVTRTGRNDYLLVGGERRLRAYEQLGRETIFAIVTRGAADEIALIDNVLRVDLNGVELATALAGLAERHGYTHEQLGAVIGRDQSDVTKILSILRLPPAILEAYLARPEACSRSVLIEIATVDDPERQLDLWQQASAGATVRELRQAKRTAATLPGAEPEPAQRRRKLAADLIRVEKTVAALADQRDALDPAQRERLRELARRIEALLG